MVSLCWTGHHLEAFIKTIKFIELCSANMLAITNLAIAVNLALIVKVRVLRTSSNERCA